MYRQFEEASDTGPCEAGPCTGCLARARAICGTLAGAELAAFGAMGRHRRLTRGQTLMWEGDAAACVANVISGVLKLTTAGVGGDEQIVGLAWPSDFIGSPFGTNMQFSVTALTDGEVCLFGRADFENFLTVHPDLERALLRRAFADLEQMRGFMAMLGRRTAGQRVAALLLALAGAEDGAEKDGNLIALPLSRQEMADLLGLTIETVSRQLGRLTDAGLIALPDRRSVLVRRREALTTFAA
jgi:CRP/FNR family transcriptional regulator